MKKSIVLTGAVSLIASSVTFAHTPNSDQNPLAQAQANAQIAMGHCAGCCGAKCGGCSGDAAKCGGCSGDAAKCGGCGGDASCGGCGGDGDASCGGCSGS